MPRIHFATFTLPPQYIYQDCKLLTRPRKNFIMSNELGRIGFNGNKLNWIISTHGNWKNQILGAVYSIELISIETYAPQFIGQNKNFLDSVGRRLLCGNLKRSDVVLRYVETCWYGAVSDLEDDWDLITLFSRDMHGSIELSLWYADCCWDNGSRQSWLIWTRFSVRNNK